MPACRPRLRLPYEENLLLNEKGNIKLADMGLAKDRAGGQLHQVETYC